MRISDWSSDVCSSDLGAGVGGARALHRHVRTRRAAARADAGQFGQALAHQVAEGAVGDLRQHRFGALGQPRLAVEGRQVDVVGRQRSEEHTSELQSLMRISYAVFRLKKKTTKAHYIN